MRYFFHVETGLGETDTEGLEAPDVAAALKQATVRLSEFVDRHPAEMINGADVTIRVADAAGWTLFSLAVKVTVAPYFRAAAHQGPPHRF